MKRPTPLDAPREFRINEMFFSTTDRTGKIASGNDVFVRVSGYRREEMLGRPHCLIRHPDMPRAVFRLIWESLLADRAVAGFVKNLAADGRHYWVVAFLMPIRGGFLSIRFKPSSPLYPTVEALYRRMVDCEREHESRGADGKTAMAASEQLLQAELRARGFDSYDAFMRTLLHEEMKCRDARLNQQALRLFPEMLPGAAAAAGERDRLEAIYAHGSGVYEQINTLYGQLDEFAELNDRIGRKSALVLEQTADFRFIAFNAALRAARLGEEGRGLGVIADYLGTASSGTSRIVTGLAERIGAISGQLRAVIFNLAAARLQIEMLLSFTAELAAGAQATESEARVRFGMIADLELAYQATAERAVNALLEVEKNLGSLDANSEDLRRIVLSLQVAQVGGLVEASRISGDDSFVVMFSDLRARVEATKQELADLDEIASRLTTLAERTPDIAAAMNAAVRQMEQEVRALTGSEDAGEPDVRLEQERVAVAPPASARMAARQPAAA